MRSLATITRSPASFWYRSRTLPVWRCARPGTCIGSGFSTNPDTVPPRSSGQVLRFSRTRRAVLTRGESGRPWCGAALSPACRSGPGGWPSPAGRGCRHGRGGPAPGTRRRCRRRRRARRRGRGRARSPGGAGPVAVPVRGVGEQDAALVLGERGAREVAVGLARDQAVASRRPRAAPVASHSQWSGVAHDQGVRLGDAARVLDAEQLLLGLVDLAPQGGLAGAVRACGRSAGGRGRRTGTGPTPPASTWCWRRGRRGRCRASRASSAVRRMGIDQYSSWPGKTRPR